MRFRSFAVTLALASFVGGIVPAIASDGPSLVVTSATNARHQQTIGYGDLDISNVQGAKILVKRIRQAAEQVCETPAGLGETSIQKHLNCVRDTVKETVASLNNPVVSAVYNGNQPSAS
jgi:UrcA family protein